LRNFDDIGGTTRAGSNGAVGATVGRGTGRLGGIGDETLSSSALVTEFVGAGGISDSHRRPTFIATGTVGRNRGGANKVGAHGLGSRVSHTVHNAADRAGRNSCAVVAARAGSRLGGGTIRTGALLVLLTSHPIGDLADLVLRNFDDIGGTTRAGSNGAVGATVGRGTGRLGGIGDETLSSSALVTEFVGAGGISDSHRRPTFIATGTVGRNRGGANKVGARGLGSHIGDATHHITASADISLGSATSTSTARYGSTSSVGAGGETRATNADFTRCAAVDAAI